MSINKTHKSVAAEAEALFQSKFCKADNLSRVALIRHVCSSDSSAGLRERPVKHTFNASNNHIQVETAHWYQTRHIHISLTEAIAGILKTTLKRGTQKFVSALPDMTEFANICRIL